MAKCLSLFEAAILLKMSPTLLKWFTSYAPKFGEKKKLKYVSKEGDIIYFEHSELLSFDQYLSVPWPTKKGERRPKVPSGIEDEIKLESKFRCVICNHASGEIAHIDPVHNSKNNHPHNLIYLCPNCHDLYDNKKTIKKKQISNTKNNLLLVKITIWKSYTSLFDCVSSLIKCLENIKYQDFKNNELQHEVITELLEAIKDHVAEDFKSPQSDAKVSKSKKTYYNYKNTIAKILNKNNKVEEKLITERKKYFSQSGHVECPLCEGSGVHNSWECPGCRGEGTVDERDLDDLDLSPFEQEECPLCKGSGIHNNWECPVCRGEGTIDQRFLDDIDLRPFEQEECPLCKGSGIHNNWECPGCRGEGTVDEIDLDDLDLSPFEQEKCPLCKGSGVHNNWECPVCRGEGTIDQRFLDDIDLSLFEQEVCPQCDGSGDYNDFECQGCRGVGTIDRRYLE